MNNGASERGIKIRFVYRIFEVCSRSGNLNYFMLIRAIRHRSWTISVRIDTSSFFLFSLSLEKQEGIKSSRISVTIDFSNFEIVRLRSLIFSTLARITINDDSCNENRVKLSAFHFIRVYSSTIKFKRTTEQDSFTISRYRRIFFFLLS